MKHLLIGIVIMTTEYALCPLYPFGSDLDVLCFSNNIKVEKAPKWFKDLLSEHCLGRYNFWDDSDKVNKVWLASLDYKDTSLYNIDPRKTDTPELISSLFSLKTEEFTFCFITSMRLHNKGLITAGPIAIPTGKQNEYLWLSPSWLNPDYDYFMEDEAAVFLQEVDIPIINNIMHNVSNCINKGCPKSLTVALDRFHSSYFLDSAARIIDHMIAFEALYLGGQQELQYKLALRVAHLIGNDLSTRSEIYQDMRNAYKLRSKIIHGGSDMNIDELSEIVPKTEEYLRISIRKYLSLLAQGFNFEHVRDKLLDQIILGDKSIV